MQSRITEHAPRRTPYRCSHRWSWRRATIHWFGNRDSITLWRARSSAKPRSWWAWRFSVCSRRSCRNVPKTVVDNATVCRLCFCKRVKQTLPLPAWARFNRPVYGVWFTNTAWALTLTTHAVLVRLAEPVLQLTQLMICALPLMVFRSIKFQHRWLSTHLLQFSCFFMNLLAKSRELLQSNCVAQLRMTFWRNILPAEISFYPPTGSMRLTTDLFAYCKERIPKWNTISTRLPFPRKRFVGRSRSCVYSRKWHCLCWSSHRSWTLEVDDFAPRLAFFFNGHNNVFQEAASFVPQGKCGQPLCVTVFMQRTRNLWCCVFTPKLVGDINCTTTDE